MASQINGGALTIAVLLVATTCLTAAARNDGHISSLRLVGSVFCDTCFVKEFSRSSYFIKGAPVAVECETGNEEANFRIETNTNEHGQFEVELPASHLKRCSAMLLQNEGPCRVASMANASSFTLKSKQGGVYTYSAGFFTYTPETIPHSCSNEVANRNFKSNENEVLRRSEFEYPQQFGVPPFFPPILSSPPGLPQPPPSLLPPFPSIPPFGIPPGLPQPPPSLLPPFPSIPPFGIPPGLPQPPPSLLPPFPSIPSFGIPPGLPQPPPSFLPPFPSIPPFGIPPFPFFQPPPIVPNPFQPPSVFPFPPNAPFFPFPPFSFIPPAPRAFDAHSTEP